jgi:hypothetical protein
MNLELAFVLIGVLAITWWMTRTHTRENKAHFGRFK